MNSRKNETPIHVFKHAEFTLELFPKIKLNKY